MIPKVHKRRHSTEATSRDFGLIAYVVGKADAVELANLAGDWTDAGWQMDAIAAGNTRVTRPFYHVTLSWPPHEHPSNEEIFDAARQCLRELGLEDHQAVIAVHRDKKHIHVHIVLNRIHPFTGKAFPTKHDFLRLERACRRIERVQGWSVDRGGFETRLVDGELELVRRPPGACASSRDEARRRAGRLNLFDRLSDVALDWIRGVIDKATRWADLHEGLARLGLHYTQYGSGARIWLRGTRDFFKPSLLGFAYGFPTLVRRLGAFAPPAQVQDLPTTGRSDCAIAGEPAAADAALTESVAFRRAILTRFYVAITSDAAILRRLEKIDLREDATQVLLQDGTFLQEVESGLFGLEGADPDRIARLMVSMAMAKDWTISESEGSKAFEQALDHAIVRMTPEGDVAAALATWRKTEANNRALGKADESRRSEWRAEGTRLRQRQAAQRVELSAAVGRRRDAPSQMLRACMRRLHLNERATQRARYPRRQAPAPQAPPDFVSVRADQPKVQPADHAGGRQHPGDEVRAGIHDSPAPSLFRPKPRGNLRPRTANGTARPRDEGPVLVLAADEDVFRDFVVRRWPPDSGRPRLRFAATSAADLQDLAQRAVRALEATYLSQVIIVVPPEFDAERLPPHPSLSFVPSRDPISNIKDASTPELPIDPDDASLGFG